MLGPELRALRKTAGLKAYELADQLEISPATLSRYELGHDEIPRKIELASRYLCEPALVQAKPEERLAQAIKEIAGR